jgi:predicted peptidase
MKVSFSIIVTPLLPPAGLCAAKETSTGFVNLLFSVDGIVRTAAIYVPPGYDESKTWPLIVYLHGGGGSGDNSGNAVNAWMKGQPIVRAIQKNPERFPALVLIPRCPKGKIWAPVPPNPIQSEWRLKTHGRNPVPDAAAHITRAIDTAMAAYAVDKKRVTLTGHSMGGEGTTRYAALNADRIAGIAPSAGSAVVVLEDVPALSRMGVWIFQGETDKLSTVELARRMVAALRSAGGEVHYTEYKGVGHGFAHRVYADAKVIQWLLNQKKAEGKAEQSGGE